MRGRLEFWRRGRDKGGMFPGRSVLRSGQERRDVAPVKGIDGRRPSPNSCPTTTNAKP